MIHLPIRTVSEANCRDHWWKKARRAKKQRGDTLLILRGQKFWRLDRLGLHLHLVRGDQIKIKMTRVALKRMDSDNLARAMKAVRDGVADEIGIDDGDERIDWVYKQTKPTAELDPGVTVSITVDGGNDI